MTRDHDDTIRVARAALDGEHIHNDGGFLNPFAGDGLARCFHLQTAIAAQIDLRELAFHPAPRGADPSAVRLRFGKRVTCAKSDKMRNRVVKCIRTDIGCDTMQKRLIRRRRGLSRGSSTVSYTHL